jgi:hypothetical protein
MNTARQIAGAVQVYASANKGWTPFDSDYYVKLLGFKLNSENGYFPGDGPGWASAATRSRTHAQSLDDLWCPVDNNPPATRHAIRSSYQVTLAGQNLLQLDNASQVLLLREIGRLPTDLKRHVESGQRSHHLVFADLHAQLGSKGKFVSGLDARWWQSGNAADWNTLRNNTISLIPDFLSVWCQPLTESEFNFLPSFGTWASSVADAPNNVLMRADGYLEFPQPGQWFIVSYTNEEVFFWLDVNGDNVMDAAEQASVIFGSNYRRVLDLTGIQAGTKYRCAVGFREATGPQRLNVFWSQDPTTTSNVGRAQKSLIPASALFFVP